MLVSIILPSRGRPASLMKLYNSLINKAKSEFEVLVGIDDDDEKMKDFSVPQFMKLYNTKRLNGIASYQNWLWPMAKGDYFFVLNDDVEVITHAWDQIIFDRMRPLNYGQTSPCGSWGTWYSEFPVIGRAGAKRLGYLMPPHFRSHGADYHIYKVYNSAGLVVNLRDLILVHNPPEDATHQYIKKINDDRLIDSSAETNLLVCPPIKMM